MVIIFAYHAGHLAGDRFEGLSMNKVFEDYLSELPADMMSICLEYVENRAEDIYIYFSYEPEMLYAFDVFYKVNGKILLKNNLNDVINETDNNSSLFDTSEYF